MNSYYGSMTPLFSYNIKTGNIMFNERSIVRFGKTDDGVKFWYKLKGGIWTIKGSELEELKHTLKWLIKNHDCDFGEDVNAFAMNEAE